jgi:cyclophilin family peptidyl-prolyl cis-trans isomerase
MMRRAILAAFVVCALQSGTSVAEQNTAGPVIVVETSRGTFSFETYPNDAPKTVAHVVELVKRGFYDGQRFHRVAPGFVIQWGDPQSRDMTKEADWGRGGVASSGQPIGVAEITRRWTHTRGAVAMAHAGDPRFADSQMYVTLANRPDLNGKYAVLGHIISGADIPEKIQKGDVINKMYVKE